MRTLHLTLVLCAGLLLSAHSHAQDRANIEQLGTIYNHWDNVNAIQVIGDLCFVAAGPAGFQVIDLYDRSDPVVIGIFNDTENGVRDFKVVDEIAYVIDGYWLYTLDVSEPMDLCVLSAIETEPGITAIDVVDDRVCLVNEFGLFPFIVEHPDSPVRGGSCHDMDYSEDVKIVGNYAYTASKNRFYVTDISDPHNPFALSYEDINVLGRITSIDIVGNIAYCGGDNRFYAFDISEPANPELIGLLSHFSSLSHVVIQNEIAFLSDRSGSVFLVDISDPENMTVVGDCELNCFLTSLDVQDEYIFTINTQFGEFPACGLHIHQIDDENNLELVSSMQDKGFVYDVAVSNGYAYVADDQAGLKVVDISDPDEPLQVGTIETDGKARYITYRDGIAYVSNEYGRFAIFDVSDPGNPELKGTVHIGAYLFGSALNGNYAYVVDDIGVMHVVDITNPEDPQEVHEQGIGNQAYDIVIANDYAYVADSDGFVVFDISIPDEPSRIGSFSINQGYGHGITFSENIVYIAGLNDGVSIVDVTDPDLPVQLAHIETAGDAMEVKVRYDRLLVADMTSGLRIYDISIPEAPVEVGYYNTPGLAHNLAVDGQLAYIADYTNLGIYDCSQILSVDGNPEIMPLGFELNAPYPNPFNSQTTIEYRVGSNSNSTIQLSIYDQSGRLVDRLNPGYVSAGMHSLTWDATGLPTGVYVVRLNADGNTTSRSINLIK